MLPSGWGTPSKRRNNTVPELFSPKLQYMFRDVC